MVMLLLSSAAIIVLSVANVGSSITVVFSPSLLGSSALMPFIGFLLGYVLSAIFKLNERYVPPLPPPLALCRQKEQRGTTAPVYGAMVKTQVSMWMYFCKINTDCSLPKWALGV